MYSDLDAIQEPSIDPPVRLVSDTTVVAWIAGHTQNERKGNARAGAALLFEEFPTRTRAIRVPTELPQTTYSARLTALLMAVQICPLTVPLIVRVDSLPFAKILSSRLEEWENIGFVGMGNRLLLQALAARVHERTAKTALRYTEAHENPLKSQEVNELADEGSRKRLPDQIDWSASITYRRPGVKLMCLTQSIATKAITEMKTKKKDLARAETMKNLKGIKTEITRINGYPPTDKNIWDSIKLEVFNRRVQNFLYLMIHGTQRVGKYWKHIPGCETYQNCDTCGVEETMKHVLLECQMPIQSLVWSLARRLLEMRGGEWPEITYELLMGCGVINVKADSTRESTARTRLFRMIVSESMHQIWKMRCDVVVKEEPVPSAPQIKNTWLYVINTRLEEDRMLTRKLKHEKHALKKALVLDTWKGTIRNSKVLPGDWTQHPEVLVGIGRKKTLATDNNQDNSSDSDISLSDYG
ncbi:hypothetical protein C8J56DRAFT_780771 [Mycena floridula]|nr:hypothetical protein C8J56DRAFT_780771 [Mycena floridula]